MSPDIYARESAELSRIVSVEAADADRLGVGADIAVDAGCPSMTAFCSYLKPTNVCTFKTNILVFIAMTAVACASSSHAQTSENATPSWLSKPAINPLPHWFEVRGGAWRVPAADVEEMASRIKAEVDASLRARLDTYIIQYQGESSGGAKLIRLMGACDIHGTSERDLSERFHIVFDGGKCFFDATYDPEEKRFTSLTYHGRG